MFKINKIILFEKLKSIILFKKITFITVYDWLFKYIMLNYLKIEK